MTKNRSTKRALLMSALALVMCFAMLIGSTFAWFTDSVTSAGNKIKAGIESAVNFAKRIAEYPINFWNKLSETEVTFEPAIKAMSKAGETFGETINGVGAKVGEALKVDVSAKAGEALHSMFDRGISAKQISKMEDISIPRQLLMDNVQAWEASLAS